jgi:hypothetical protein
MGGLQTSRVPSLDNGEWVWALKAAVEALEQREQPTLAKRYSVPTCPPQFITITIGQLVAGRD